MDVWTEATYNTPLSHSPLFPLLLLSLMRQKHSPDCSEKIKNEYDYIIVGGGTAGSVLAARLSEEPCVNVLVLEAGLKPPLISEVPGLKDYLKGTDVDWNFEIVPQKHSSSAFKGKKMNFIQGKMLGGSGSFNNLFYSRGNRKDYDDWAAQGAKGWSYEDVFPYFLKLEDNMDYLTLDEGFHHVGGPITIETPRFQSHMKNAFHEVAKELGYHFVDPNGARQTGFYDHQLNTREGQRCSSVKGYLVPAEHRSNLDIFLNSTVTKIIIKGQKAEGVEFYHNGEFQSVKARKEVIVSAGVANTPKLLMISGIGPREELDKWNIPVISDLPVGKNLQDHGAANLHFTFDSQFSVSNTYSASSAIEEFIDHRSGPLLNNAFAGAAFLSGINSTTEADFPHFVTGILECSVAFFDRLVASTLEPKVYKQLFGTIDKTRGFGVCLSQLLHPRSRGTITLRSSDPFDPPVIDPNYLEHPKDVDDIVEGQMMCKRILNSETFQRYGAKLLDSVMPGCEEYAKSDEDYFRCYTRSIFSSAFHGVGTAKMGNSKDPTTVVDPELKVKGVKGLRVVDASVIPIIPSCNTNIPTIMVAEKASDVIRKSIKCFKGKKLYDILGLQRISELESNFIQK